MIHHGAEHHTGYIDNNLLIGKEDCVRQVVVVLAECTHFYNMIVVR